MLNSHSLDPWWKRLLPPPTMAGRGEQLRAAAGALLAMLLTAYISTLFMGPGAAWLIAPMGASAVLLFCLHGSPLAQPWPVIIGNTLSALVGVACAAHVADPTLAAPLAGGLAILLMFFTRSLHPPGGAVALSAVLGGPEVQALGYQFALLPVALNASLMVAAALLFNNATGRRYPHFVRPAQATAHSSELAPGARLGFERSDLDAVLARYGQVLDLARDDLEDIILATEAQAYERRFGIMTCGAVMSKPLATAHFDTKLGEAWRCLRYHQAQAMPVVDQAGHVIGMVSQADFLRHSDLDDFRTLRARLLAMIGRMRFAPFQKQRVVGQIMNVEVKLVYVDTPVVQLVSLMAQAGLHHIVVLDAEHRLAGIVTQSDVIAALYQKRLSEGDAVAPAGQAAST